MDRRFSFAVVTLPPGIERLLDEEVAAGRVQDVEAFVADSVRDELRYLANLQRSLEKAEQSYREGRGIPWETVRARLTKRFNLDG